MEACPHCRANLPADATFCPSCDRRADAEDRDAPIDVQARAATVSTEVMKPAQDQAEASDETDRPPA